MVYYVYILECYINREFSCYYCGQTDNLEKRKGQHIRNVIFHYTKKFTGRFDYCKLIWYGEVQTRADAIRLEQYLKSLNQQEKEEYMENYGEVY